MSLFIGQPHLQYCENCNWNHVVTSDCLMYSYCPECETKLKLKPLPKSEMFKYSTSPKPSFLKTMKKNFKL